MDAVHQTSGTILECGRGWLRAVAAGLSFRASGDSDLAFLEMLYGTVRADELALVDWSEAQKAAFVAMQFHAQHTHYHENYIETEWLIVEHNDRPVGRLYIARWPLDHRVVDIAFLPECRGRGFGTALLSDICDEAAQIGRSVSIHVEKFNPARTLYQRLGFVVVEDKGVYDLMRWTPDQVKTAS